MNATDVAPTRLDRAKQLAREHVASLGPRDEMAILSAGDAIGTVCGLTTCREALEQAVAAASPSTGRTRVADAVAVARQLVRGKPNGRILVLTDGCFDRAAELARHEDLDLVAIGGPGDNVAITRLAARRSRVDPARCEVFVEVSRFAGEPVECSLGLALDGEPIEAVPMAPAAEGRWQRVFTLTAAEPGRLIARLDRPDVLPADNRASVAVPPSARASSLEGELVASRPPAVESDVRVPARLASSAPMPVRVRAGPAIWRLVAAAALVLVAIEWYLFQRRWLC